MHRAINIVLDYLANGEVEIGSATHGPVGTLIFAETGRRVRDWKQALNSGSDLALWITEATGLGSAELLKLESTFEGYDEYEGVARLLEDSYTFA